ncbi:hypothetical protein CSW08_09385 [Confluentibacter flavum]|uniref:Uncharacterized protein n=1 Tax=Confluentibacter flavum TaxID=1909700 RepID=A0A2N3HJU5_9FLAO|nr:hypothetical protein CSW08_09385 [Confluentibacter flavum]
MVYNASLNNITLSTSGFDMISGTPNIFINNNYETITLMEVPSTNNVDCEVIWVLIYVKYYGRAIWPLY